MPAATTVDSKNLLLPVAADGAPAPVFVGEQRAKVLAALAKAVHEQKVLSVMQAINKDPSLVFEMLDMPSSAKSKATQSVEFPLACLRSGLTPGYLFAISKGFPVDKLLQNETTTLLQTALQSHSAPGSDATADIGLLLSLGAKLDAMVSKTALYEVIASSYPRNSDRHTPGAVNMLIDAKCDFGYPDDIDSPFVVLVATGGWEDEDKAHELVMAMVRLAKAGVNPDKRTGSTRKTPLETAIGKANGPAIVGLILIGASTDPSALKNRDLLEVMRGNAKLAEFIPMVQSALMESHISKSDRNSAGPAAAAVDAPTPRDIRRQRIGL